MSKRVLAARETAAKHRHLGRLYDRLAAQLELADNLETYSAKLNESTQTIEAIEKQITDLQNGPVREVTRV